ncbi:MAG: c-type cytochrome [Hyphomicrobium sp.]
MTPNRPFQQAIALTLAALTLSASAIFASQLAAQSAEPAMDKATAASADGGEEAFNNACRTCHSVKPGDNRLGPSLAGIVGKKAGGEAGYAYSPSLKGSGVTFDAKTLDAFIASPDSVVAGNNMKPYTGISDAAVRAKIVAFLGGK